MALIHIERLEWDKAEAALSDALLSAKRASYRRALADVPLIRSLVHAARGNFAAARADLATAIPLYAQLGIDEARTYRMRARVARCAGEFAEAEALLAQGRTRAKEYPVERADIILEQLAVGRALGDTARVAELMDELEALYLALGAKPRHAALVKARAAT